MRMLSIPFYFEIKDRNVKSGRYMKCGIIVSHCVGRYQKRFQILILNGLARGAYTYKQTNIQIEPLISDFR